MLRTVLRKESSKCKGLEVGVCQVYLENTARRPMWLGQRKQGEIGGNEVTEETGLEHSGPFTQHEGTP